MLLTGFHFPLLSGLAPRHRLLRVDAHHAVFDPFHEGVEDRRPGRAANRLLVAPLVPLGFLAGDAILLERRIGGDHVDRAHLGIEPRRGERVIDPANGGVGAAIGREVDPRLHHHAGRVVGPKEAMVEDLLVGFVLAALVERHQ